MLLLVPSLGALTVDNRAGGTAYALGAVFGQVALALIVALLIRWLYARGRQRGVLWHPWLLVIAGAVSLLLTLGALSRAVDDSSPSDDGDGSALLYDRADDLLRVPPAGLRYEPVSAPELRRFRGLIAREGTGQFRDFAVRRVVGPGGFEAVAVILTATASSTLDEVVRGYEDAGGVTSDGTVGGERVRIGRVPGQPGVQALLTDSNAVGTVYAASERDAVRVARGLLRSFE